MKELENLLAKCGFVKRASAKNDFQAVEALIGFQLPSDYKYYLENYEQFQKFIGEQYIALYRTDELVVLNERYEIKDYISNTLTIGSNGAGEFIGIKLVGQDNYQIIIAPFIGGIDDQIEIGSSFTDMLKRLNEGILWFK